MILKKLLISGLCMTMFAVPVMAESDTGNTTTETEGNSVTTKTTTTKYEVSATIKLVFEDGTYTYKNISVGEKLKEPSHEEIKDKKFLGWYNEETGEMWDFDDPIEGNMTLIAKYEGGDIVPPTPTPTVTPDTTPSPEVSPTVRPDSGNSCCLGITKVDPIKYDLRLLS